MQPLIAGRDYHATHHENPAFRFEPELAGDCVTWQPYPGVPAIHCAANALYQHAPDWYRAFTYAEEAARGLDAVEDLASPGVFTFDFTSGAAAMVLSTAWLAGEAAATADQIFAAEAHRRAGFASPLARAADAYRVFRAPPEEAQLPPRGRSSSAAPGSSSSAAPGSSSSAAPGSSSSAAPGSSSSAGGPLPALADRTIIAGYPWFGDWGRDTFISLRGLCLATGRRDDARAILLAWAPLISRGMLPNRFDEGSSAPEYNSVDAALWFVIAADAYLAGDAAPGDRAALTAAIAAILDGHLAGTRHGIRVDVDGLLACGELGTQLTWMDARVGDRSITPRVGKPVEIQALWINALIIAGRTGEAARARAAFDRFWDPARQQLHDVIDCEHVPGTVDPTCRPNQILAIGGVPHPVVTGARAAAIVATVERVLWTPAGLRTLDPADPRYVPHYAGDPAARDAAYHNGAVWPWLAGPFIEAWLRVQPSAAEPTAAARQRARTRFLAPLLDLATATGHLPELCDGAPPHRPAGCPFQAWSLAEALRLDRLLGP